MATPTPAPTDYHLCIERSDNSWIVYAPTLPGCFTATRGDSPQTAIDAMPQAISDWYAWAEVAPPVADAVRVVIDEQIGAWLVAPGDDLIDEVNAFFAADRPPLSADDVTLALDLLQRTRADLLATIAGLDDAALVYTAPDEWSIQQTLLHLGVAEWWYMSNLNLDPALEYTDLLPDPLPRLEQVRSHLCTALPRLIGDDRLTQPRYETWTPRKLLRRAVWHERDHTAHIRRLRTLLPPNLAIGG